MTESYGIAGQALELLDTMDEGLNYLQTRLQNGFLEESSFLLKDISDAQFAVGEALEGMQTPEDMKNALQSASDELKRCFVELEKSYQQSEPDKARFELQVAVIPAFRRWNEILRAYLGPVANS